MQLKCGASRASYPAIANLCPQGDGRQQLPPFVFIRIFLVELRSSEAGGTKAPRSPDRNRAALPAWVLQCCFRIFLSHPVQLQILWLSSGSEAHQTSSVSARRRGSRQFRLPPLTPAGWTSGWGGGVRDDGAASASGPHRLNCSSVSRSRVAGSE